ncbi:NAD/NADP octopine/nopaline dehydrogenase family protein [bacterium]|nr:NAD/NADP octopine/nopaline dehydrogenase family protein [bacterium]
MIEQASRIKPCKHSRRHAQPATQVVRCGVVGAGNSAHALSCYLAQQGHHVYLYARRAQQLAHLGPSPRLRASGQIEGTFPLSGAGSDPRRLAQECSTLFVCTTATAYPDVIEQLAPFLHGGHTLILFSSKLCGSLEVERCLLEAGKPEVAVIETDALFACRVQSDHSVWVRGFKGWNLFCSPRPFQTHTHRALIQRFFPQLEPAQNLLHRGLTDFGALAHALTVLVNVNSVDRGDPFLFYYQGFTENTVVLLEQLEREFQNLAGAYGCSLLSASQLLNRYYQCETGSLLQAMRSVPNYRHSQAPTTLSTRYLSEDVSCSLVPAQQLARLAGLESPMLDSIVAMASVLHGIDYRRQGRTLEKLGWGGYTAQEISHWVND